MEWKAYTKIRGPFGVQRGDMQAALMPYIFTLAFSGKNAGPPKFEDFMLKFGERARRKQTQEEIWAVLKMAAQFQNARHEKGEVSLPR